MYGTEKTEFSSYFFKTGKTRGILLLICVFTLHLNMLMYNIYLRHETNLCIEGFCYEVK